MRAVLLFVLLIVCAVIVFAVPAIVAPFTEYSTYDAGQAVLFCLTLAIIVGCFVYRNKEYRSFLLQLFGWALVVRMLVATGIFIFNVQEFFGGDAITYDYFGYAQMKAWQGDSYYLAIANHFMEGQASAWGMINMVALVYSIIGRNTLAIQFVNSIIGAATAVLVFSCAQHVYQNVRVAKIAAIYVAFFPSLVLWSAQGLKDAPIVFFLVLAILASLRLSEKLSVKHGVILIAALFSILSLRFYVFYMIVVAIAGGFLIGLQKITPTNFARQFVVILMMGVSLTYLGVTRYANAQFSRYATLEAVNRSRADLARAGSGFGQEVDVSTTEGAISTIPIGLIYLLFAPFPWQLVSLRQSITLPEMIIWWLSFPLMVLGVWYSIKYRLRQISPILIFTTMLSIAYSVFQGNVGTAYRQRAQLLVFYFIFVAVGFVLLKEKKENLDRFRKR
ncbi:MAG TPA: glycosyltransferase family 39 protein [Pyrinomonadaceae bacterium]|jgi:dolichyl-phosphate-mannose-protein mannosyltransferase|nr:glycosyltransferase family 39 protein [Pyrinomonadaceae bacterium]